jgi:DNA repair photolyase
MKVTSGTREWADHNVNCFYGCENDCLYCYAKMMAKRYGRSTETAWKKMRINKKAVEKRYGKYNGRVMFPTSHDIVDVPEVIEACFKVLKKLVDAGNSVLVTTKPDFNVTQKLITEFSDYRNLIQFRFTISSNNNDLLSFWESNAPPYRVRLESLKLAYEKDFKTSVSIEPFLDFDPIPLINELSPYVTESIWIGPMNYIPRKNIAVKYRGRYESIRGNYTTDNIRLIMERLKDYPKIRFKDSMIRLSKWNREEQGMRIRIRT